MTDDTQTFGPDTREFLRRVDLIEDKAPPRRKPRRVRPMPDGPAEPGRMVAAVVRFLRRIAGRP